MKKIVIIAGAASFIPNLAAFLVLNSVLTLPNWAFIVAGFILYGNLLAVTLYSKMDEKGGFSELSCMDFSFSIITLVSFISLACPESLIDERAKEVFILLTRGANVFQLAGLSAMSIFWGIKKLGK